MKLIIEIPKKVYNKAITRGHYTIDIADYLKNGTPLPKGHGRLADMDEAIKCIEELNGEDAIWAISLINWACGKRTIIEADKESEE